MRKSILYSIGTWVVAILMSLDQVTGWSEIRYSQPYGVCGYSRDDSRYYYYAILILASAIPLITSTVSYVLLYCTVRRSTMRITAGKRNANPVIVDVPKDVNGKPAGKTDWKFSRMLLVTYLLYLASVVPYLVVKFVDVNGQLPVDIHIMVTWLVFSNVAVNPFVYGLMNSTFREAYSSAILKCMKRNTVSVGQS